MMSETKENILQTDPTPLETNEDEQEQALVQIFAFLIHIAKKYRPDLLISNDEVDEKNE